MKKFLTVLDFLEKYSINFNELALACVINSAKQDESSELVEEYFNTRMCCRGCISEMLPVLQQQGIISKDYVLPKKGESLDLQAVPLTEDFKKDLLKLNN